MGKQLFELVSAPLIAAYWETTQDERVAYLGELYFPSAKKLGLDLSWIKGRNNIDVMLRPSYFDAKATVRDRIGLERTETSMPFFREAMSLKEKDRQELLKIEESNTALYKDFIVQIYNDRANLLKGALVVPERMRMQMLVDGKITIVDNNVTYEYNYDESGEWTANNTVSLSGTSVWSDTENATPIQDLMEMMDTVEDATGTRPTRALMTRKTFGYFNANKSIKLDMNPIGGLNIIMTDAMMLQYISAKLGLTIVVYNKNYGTHDGNTKQFYPDDYVTLLPNGPVGKTWFGTTPEEADLRAGAGDASVEIVETGIALTTYKQVHPVNLITVASEIVLPSFEKMDEVAVLKVN